ncbi:MAG: hypothetical protein ABSG02_22845 [Terriglobales bacterium]|jgi:hypothetical protein
MRYDIPRLGKKCLGRKCLVAAALLALAVQFASASNPSLASRPLVSGSYEVVQNTARGSETQIRVRIHLVNHGPSDLSIQRITLWDLSHPEKGGSRGCALTVRAHASAETVQEFTIKRSDYQLWRRGFRPRLVLQTAGAGNAKSKAVVRRDRMSGRAPLEEAK